MSSSEIEHVRVIYVLEREGVCPNQRECARVRGTCRTKRERDRDRVSEHERAIEREQVREHVHVRLRERARACEIARGSVRKLEEACVS